VVERYPDLCLAFEFENYKKIKKQREEVKIDEYRWCFTGPEPEIPEWEQERKKKREEMETKFREQTLTELSPEEMKLTPEEKKKRIDAIVSARMEMEEELSKDDKVRPQEMI